MPASAPNFQPGHVLPGTKYTVVRELGAGGMGVVYQVEKPPGITGVLKLMSRELASTREFQQRFLDEVRILAKLDHPNIVKVNDYDALADGTPYYVMELLSGRTLRDALSTMGRLPARVAFEVTRQLLEALHAAHTFEIPVVHRDIKPENIFLHVPRHGEPCVKLIDFGVIAVADRQHDGMFVGTWRYAAPEQIRGERATPATDLYAVGLVLYEMLAGRGPFDHYETGSLVSQAHLREVPRPVSELAAWVPPSVAQLVNAALMKDPRGRPRDAHAFAERLFELEWANDGTSPPEPTAEGPVIKRVLETIGAAKPVRDVPMTPAAPAVAGAGGAAAAAPLAMPVINVPAGEHHRGGTLEGLGGGRKNATTPDEDSLLEGLEMRPDERVPSKKSRESGGDLPRPRVSATPTPGQVVIRPSKSNPLLAVARPPTAATMDSDTFASQHSDARGVPKQGGRIVWPIVLAAIAVLGIAAFVVVKLRANSESTTVVTPASAPPPASSPVPPAVSTSVAMPDPLPVASSASPPPAVSAAPKAVVGTRPIAPKVTHSATAVAPATSKPRDDFMRGGP